VVPMGRPRDPTSGDLGGRHRRPALDPEAPFSTEHSGAAVIEQYRRQCEISNEVLQSRDLHAELLGGHGLDWPDEPITDIRWVALHMTERTARHAGHLDVARELLDGITGRGPPLAEADCCASRGRRTRSRPRAPMLSEKPMAADRRARCPDRSAA
jgi:hypothetical protein